MKQREMDIGLRAMFISAMRNLGHDSFMNVWRKQFTSENVFDNLAAMISRDYFSSEDFAPKIGDTITIKTPPRFVTRSFSVDAPVAR